MSDENRYGFTVYSDSYEGAEFLRNRVVDELVNMQTADYPWDVDSEVTDYGPEEDEEEAK